jgi:RNA polymerase sigma-70 factor (ECF subfamily)
MLTAKGKRDYELILQAKQGDQRAYEKLMSLYSRNIFFEIQKLVRNEEQANDLMMESMAKAFMQLNSYEPKYAFSTWIKRICINHTIDSLRKKRLDTVSIDGVMDSHGESAQVDLESTNRTPEEEIERTERLNDVKSLVNSLKGIYKELILLRYFDELSYNEISEHTQLPEGTVKARLHRAKGMLRNMITDSAFEVGHL